MNRYKETRRRHPLAPTGSVAAGIARERELLDPLRGRADVVIDTTGLTAAMLRRKLADEMLPSQTPGRLAVTFQSFGFKHGPARDPDLLFDVRFLPNPHYEADLRPLTGTDQRVVDFINRDGELDAFYDRLLPLLDYLLPQYLAEGKAHLVVAIGCTGGRHRSVAIAERLAERYGAGDEYLIEVSHRDTGRAIWEPEMIDHIGFEVSDLNRSAVFYDAVLGALGARRLVDSDRAVAYGVSDPVVWIVARGRAPSPGYGHVALQASGKAAVDAAYAAGVASGGRDGGAPGRRPRYGARCYAAYLLDPDGLRVEVVSSR